MLIVCFFFNDTATTEIYTLSLHDALPIYDLEARRHRRHCGGLRADDLAGELALGDLRPDAALDGRAALGRRALLRRSEEHTSELQSRQYLVCRLPLDKKNRHTLHA